MLNFEDLFSGLEKELNGQLRLLQSKSKVKVYCGINKHGGYRISFMSTIAPPRIDSTKGLKVSHLQEDENVFWTSFDLINQSAKPVFFSLCDDLLAVINEHVIEQDALTALKNRFFAWQNLFMQNSSALSEEKIIGLLGELYFLYNCLIPKFSPQYAIDAWSGPEGANKDFSTEQSWYEVKTASVNINTVKINSPAQLSSPLTGYLVILRYETMSEQYNDEASNIIHLFRKIMPLLDNNELKSKFISKLLVCGFDVNGDSYKKKYRIDSMNFYKVENGFPRITEQDIKFPEIDKVTYTLHINSLENFKVEEVK